MKTKNALISLTLLMFITVSIAGFEFFTAVKNFKPDGNVFDFCAGAVEYIPYFMIFLLVLFTALPIALLLFKENHISIKTTIFDQKHLKADILKGFLLGIISAIIAYPFSLMRDFGSKYTHTTTHDNSLWFYILGILSLSLVCGFLKELYFRGFAKLFLSDTFGETTSYILTAILFGIVDWQNMGSSILLGLLWGYAYKKNNRLIVPIIAHSMINAIGIIWMLIF
ncbi:MAG: CPBP family intramembrane glutamic endopeptidase [Acutalibacteraceae bacterium]|nr:CPBP family intramembrane glutamic endopeptidase [Acutalibacteraceae bacterium]